MRRAQRMSQVRAPADQRQTASRAWVQPAAARDRDATRVQARLFSQPAVVADVQGATEVVSWSRDEMPNLRPVLRITHQFIYSPPDVPAVTLLAAKRIYGNLRDNVAADLKRLEA